MDEHRDDTITVNLLDKTPSPEVRAIGEGLRALGKKGVLVGERGPEIFIPEVAGRVLPHAESMRVARMSTAVKFLKGSDTKFEGLAIPFGGPIAGKDLDGEDFGADTDFALDWFPQGRPVIYHHGLTPSLKAVVQGRQSEHELIDEGIFVRGELDASAKYHEAVAGMIAAGKLYFSSGSVPHLVDVGEDGHIKTWPWVELSLTPTPANPYATVHSVKSAELMDHLAALDLAVPPALIASALKALDAPPTSDDALLDGAFLDRLDRFVVDGPEWVKARLIWYAKSGRVLSAATRERLLSHPTTLRQLADDLDELIANADAPKEGKSIPNDVFAKWAATQECLAIYDGFPITLENQS